MTKTQRAAIVAHLSSAERVRISRDGRVDAYGQMPNSIVTGWYFAGWVEDLLASIAQERA
jgi:hypothetical protein